MSVIEETVSAVRMECDRQLDISGLPGVMVDSIRDPKTGNLFRGHPLTISALPLVTFEAVGGGLPSTVVSAGAAMEFLLTACDILDDLQDGAPLPAVSSAGGASVPAYAVEAERMVALLFLADRAISCLVESSVPSSRVLGAASVFNELKLRAFAGQYDDVHGPGGSTVSPEESLATSRKKSGSLGRAAAALGATLGSNNADLVSSASEFGERVGTICQLNNDIADLWPVTGKLDDIATNKPTLPLAYAASLAAVSTGSPGSKSQTQTGSHDYGAERDRVIEAGGLHFAYAHVAIEYVKARKLCRQIQEKNPGSRLGELVNLN